MAAAIFTPYPLSWKNCSFPSTDISGFVIVNDKLINLANCGSPVFFALVASLKVNLIGLSGLSLTIKVIGYNERQRKLPLVQFNKQDTDPDWHYINWLDLLS